MRMNPTLNAATMLSAAVATLALAGCGGPSASDAVPVASVTPTDPTAAAAQAQAEADRAALQAREDQLAKREAELALAAREQELAQRVRHICVVDDDERRRRTRIGHLRLVVIDDDGPSPAGGSVLPMRLVRGGAAWWLVATLGHGHQSSVYLRLWPRDLSTGYFSALRPILRCAAASRSTPS